MAGIHSINAGIGPRRSVTTDQFDSASLWPAATVLLQAREAVQHASEVREQKVAELKQRILDGTYTVSSSALARKMLAQSPRAFAL